MLDSPFVYETDLVASVTVTVTLNPDPKFNKFPDDHDHFTLVVVYDVGTTLPSVTISLPSTTISDPFTVSFQGAPAGGNARAYCFFYAANDWQSGQGVSDWTPVVGIVGLPASLAGLNAAYATLRGLQLSGKDLTGADFSNATLQDVNFVGSTLDSAQFVNAQLQGDSTIASAVLSGCNLIDANFQGANLTSVEFSNSFFYGGEASVDKATLQLADFGGAYLEKVDFSTVLNADFEGVDFTNACLVNTNFSNCNIRDFSGTRATFSGACLQGANFKGAKVFANFFNAAVAEEPGTIQVTTLFGTPPTLQTIPIPYGKTIELGQATNNQTICPDNSFGPCSAKQLIGSNPPTSWQPANADELRAAHPPAPCDRPIRHHGRIVEHER